MNLSMITRSFHDVQAGDALAPMLGAALDRHAALTAETVFEVHLPVAAFAQPHKQAEAAVKQWLPGMRLMFRGLPVVLDGAVPEGCVVVYGYAFTMGDNAGPPTFDHPA